MGTRFGLWCLRSMSTWQIGSIRRVAGLIGVLLFLLIVPRRRITLINIRLCFPHLTKTAQYRLAFQHVIAFTKSLFDRAILWYAPLEKIQTIITTEGFEQIHQLGSQPFIVMTPHFVGLDAAWSAVSQTRQFIGMYAHQKNKVFDQAMFDGRNRFNQPIPVSRQDGMKKFLRDMKAGHPAFFLPDMDLGAKDAVFVPFFGVQAATVTSTARLAKLLEAKILPCIVRMTETGYHVKLYPPLENFPGNHTIEEATLQINQLIETHVHTMPEQYLWLHKRFKTRPPGEASFYKKR